MRFSAGRESIICVISGQVLVWQIANCQNCPVIEI
jgi:hypothetical protein